MPTVLENGNSIKRITKSLNAFRTISEASTELNLPQHVLRFWETKFNNIKPLKRGGGRRYYRPEDINLLRRIRDLLYVDGYTIKGVQKILNKSPDSFILEEKKIQPNNSLSAEVPLTLKVDNAFLDKEARILLKELLRELEEVQLLIKAI